MTKLKVKDILRKEFDILWKRPGGEMGSPKQPQRLQLSRPEEASETIALRSPISSRIWQAEDPTSNSGFDGEDVCMRHFCVSVHGDHEPMEGSFSFDGDGILEVHKDYSVDTDGTYSFHESREDQISANQGELPNSENVLDCKEQMRASDIQEGVVKDFSLHEKEKEIVHENVELIQTARGLGNEISKGNLVEGCKEVANGEQRGKTYTSDLRSLNKAGDPQEKQYRSIAISPIVPPDGRSSFTFQTGIRDHQTSSGLSCDMRADENETCRKEALLQSHLFEPTPSNHNDGLEPNVQYRSVAVSPIIPPGDTSSFTFQSGLGSNAQEDLKVCGINQSADPQRIDIVPKTCSPECICVPSSHNDGTDTRVEYKSIAVSPIIPPEGSSFTFHALRTVSGSTTGRPGTQCADLHPKTYSFELTPPSNDVGTQADRRAECVSVAVSPIIPPDGSSSFIFQSEQPLNTISGGMGTETNCVKPPLDHIADPTTQTGTKVQYVSVAISPIVISSGSSSFTFLAEKPVIPPAIEDNRDNNITSTDNLPKTYSFELTPPDDEPGARIEYRSVAVSPIIPPDEVSFTFQKERTKDFRCVDALPKKYSFELTPPNHDIGTQADNKVECISVAVSPIVISQESSSFPFQTDQTAPKHDQTQKQDTCSAPPKLVPTPQYQDVGIQVDIAVQCTSIAVSPMVPLPGSCSFVFQSEHINQASTGCSHLQEKPLMIDAEMQVSFPVETRSIATDPMTPRGKSPQASYPEVHVKEAKTAHPEPVREVSWDEKGMTWEVYGASMEVEVLGMAIQKHLEKQIEEHGRQKVMTPQSTRGSSVRGATVKNEPKRQPGAFRTFFHSVRRPRCCSRAAPTVE